MAESGPSTNGPFARALGPAFEALPPALRAFHGVDGVRQFFGNAEIEVSRGFLAKTVLRVAGFPRQSGQVPLEIVVEAAGGREVWRRDFGGVGTVSQLRFQDGQTLETFGIVTCQLGLSVEKEQILVGVERAWIFRLVPLPKRLTPISTSVEWADDQGRFCFDIKVDLPGVGRLIRYRGHIV